MASDMGKTIRLVGSGLLRKGLTLAVLPLYTRAMLPGAFGVVGYGMALLLMLGVVATLSLPSAASRFVIDTETPRARRELLSTLLVTVGVTAVVVSGCMVIGAWAIQPVGLDSGGNDMLAVVLGLAACLSGRAGSSTLASYSLARTLHDSVAAAETLEEVVKHTLMVSMALMGHLTPVTYFWGTAMGIWSGVAFLAWVNREDVRWTWSPTVLRAALVYSSPLILHSAAYNGVHYLDRLILAPTVGAEALGVYHLTYSLAFAPFTVVLLMVRAWSPLANLGFKEGNPSRYRAMSDAVAAGGGLTGLCVVITLPLVLSAFFPGAYRPPDELPAVLVLSELLYLLYTASVLPLTYHKRNGIIPVITILALVTNASLLVLLVPHYGLIGAGWATVAAFGVMGGGTLVAAHRLTSESISVTALSIVGATVAAVLAFVYAPGPWKWITGVAVAGWAAWTLANSIRAFTTRRLG